VAFLIRLLTRNTKKAMKGITVSAISAKFFDVMDDHSAVTRGPRG